MTQDPNAKSAPTLGSSSWSQADDRLAAAMTGYWEELPESEKTFFVFCVVVAAFVWYGLILGMAFED